MSESKFYKEPAFWLTVFGLAFIEGPQGVQAWRQLSSEMGVGVGMSIDFPGVLDPISRVIGFALFGIALYMLNQRQASHALETLSPNVLTPPIMTEQDALSHVVIQEQALPVLRIDKTDQGRPIMFPLLIRNTRPTPIELSKIDVEPYGDGRRWTGITWPSGGRGLCSNGGKLIVEDRINNHNPVDDSAPIQIPGDDYRVVRVPIYVSQVQPKPQSTPVLTLTGKLTFRCGEAVPQEIDAPGRTLPLSLDNNDWNDLVSYVQR